MISKQIVFKTLFGYTNALCFFLNLIFLHWFQTDHQEEDNVVNGDQNSVALVTFRSGSVVLALE